MAITFTAHALEALAERQILPEWVIAAVTDPDWIEPDKTQADVKLAYRAVAERNARVLRVAYTERAGNVVVITSFFDRRKRGGRWTS